MAKEVDLSQHRPKNPPQQQDDDSTIPPPAKPVPGVTSGRPPLPTGKAVVRGNPVRLTEQERRQLEHIGWKEGQPIPQNMARIIAEAEADAEADVAEAAKRPPVDPSTPPLEVETVQIGSLPPEKQDEYQGKIQQALAEEAAAQAQQERQQQTAATPEVARKVMSARQLPETEPAKPKTKAVNPKAAQQTEPSQPRSREPLEESVAPVDFCPHCKWDLSLPDIPEPDYADRQLFLQSLLGLKPFVKDYDLVGGQIKITFRTLTRGEIDAIYSQAFREQQDGKIVTPQDFYERVNRLRLMLQLQKLESTVFSHDLPDGLTKETSPNADCHWKFSDDETEPLLRVEEFILESVLPTESLNRVVQQTCGRFNRAVSKMEALIDNPDFWKATE